MKMKNAVLFLLVFALCASLLAGCGSKAPSFDPAAEFLLGSWFARTASQDGVTVDAYDVFGGYFQLYFAKNGECTMSIDQQRAIVKWELTDGGVTLTGDNTYSISFPDESRKTMVIVINGVDVLLEKYEES